jgi:DNA-directed RNA polymerase subunit RPC12/RpoP
MFNPDKLKDIITRCAAQIPPGKTENITVNWRNLKKDLKIKCDYCESKATCGLFFTDLFTGLYACETHYQLVSEVISREGIKLFTV